MDERAECPYCGKRIVTEAELENDPWAGCTGQQELMVDPYLEEVYGEEEVVRLCPGRWMTRKDDI